MKRVKRVVLLAPLRKIVREFPEQKTYSRTTITIRMEELECGHTIRQKRDIYGPTNAYRRRCRFCLAALGKKGEVR